jgi:hypothetical protein
MAQAILEYLQSNPKDFNKGLDLLRQYVKNKALTDNLARKGAGNAYAQEKIVAQLQRYLALQGIESPTLAKAINFQNGSTLVLTKQATPSIADLQQKYGELLGMREHLQAQLELVSADETRANLATQILSLDEQADIVQLQLNALKKGEPLPSPPAPEGGVFELPTDKFELQKLLANYRSYVAKKHLAEKNPEEYQRRQHLIPIIEEKLK